MKQGIDIRVVLWFLVCLWAAPATSGAEIAKDSTLPMVRIPGEVEISRDRILLGDIARISGLGNLAGEMLGQTELGRAPKAGRVKLLKQGRLMARIQASPHCPPNMVFDLPQTLYLKRAGQVLDPALVEAEVEGYLTDRLETDTWEIGEIRIRKDEVYPLGETVLVPVVSKSRLDKRGNLSLVLGLEINGVKEDLIRVSARVAHYREVVVTLGDIQRGQRLSGDLLGLEQRNLFSLRQTPVFDLDQAVDRQLTRSMAKGEVVDAHRLQALPLIEKGDVITLVAHQGNVRILTSGISMEEGYADQPIEVENLRSGKVVRGLVRAKTTVEVIY